MAIEDALVNSAGEVSQAGPLFAFMIFVIIAGGLFFWWTAKQNAEKERLREEREAKLTEERERRIKELTDMIHVMYGSMVTVVKENTLVMAQLKDEIRNALTVRG